MNKNIFTIGIALFLAVIANIFPFTEARAEDQLDVKLGILLGYTGPIESLAPDIASGAELAIKEVNNSGAFLGGAKVNSVRADSTCVDAGAATAAAERLITSDRVNAIVGADCSGVTTAVLRNVAMPYGIVMISPSATSPSLSTIDDNDLFFRTAPSDARQGEIVADILHERGYKTAAITYTNNDYGKGLADSIRDNFQRQGGTVTIDASHEDGKADYSGEVTALAQAGGDILVVAGYLDQGGRSIIQAALDTGAFDIFYLPDGMIGESLPQAIGPDLNGSFGSRPDTNSPGANTFNEMANAAGFTPGPFTKESYDAAALILLAMQAADSTDSQSFKLKIGDIANAPGVKIYPGELAKGLKLIAAGEAIDYVGASDVEMKNNGESSGSFAEIEIQNGKNVTIGYR